MRRKAPVTASPIRVFAMALVGVSLLPAAAHAQANTDPAREAAERAEDEPNIVVRYRERYETLRDHGIRFMVGSILPGASLSAGAGLARERLLGTMLGASIDGAWSIRGYQEYDATFGRIKGREHRTELAPFDEPLTSVFNDEALLAFGTSVFVEWRSRIYPRVDFFGLGPDSDVEDRSDFRIEGSSLDLVMQWQRDSHLGVSLRAGTLDLRLAPGTNHGVPNTEDVYTPDETPGLDTQRPYTVAGAAVTLDFRDRPSRPAAGTFAGIAVWHAAGDADAGTRQAWTRIVADARQFVTIGGSGHVLAVHALLSTPVGAAPRTPFYLQPTLGGSRSMRGFGSYRLRGDAAWTATAEYRWRPHRWIEVVPFVDVGAVAADFAALGDAGVTASPGIGLRAATSSRVIGRLDIAGGRDGVRAVLTLGAPF